MPKNILFVLLPRTASTEAYNQMGLEELKSALEKLHPLQ